MTKLLIIDDDSVDRQMLIRALSKIDASTIVESSSGAEALSMLEEHTFDCVLVDYMLPDTDGLSLTEAIKKTQPSIPIIAITGQGDELVAAKFIKAGANDYLPKDKVKKDGSHFCETIVSVMEEMNQIKACRNKAMQTLRQLNRDIEQKLKIYEKTPPPEEGRG